MASATLTKWVVNRAAKRSAGAKESVGCEALKRPEGWAVNGVDNNRNARARAAQPAQNAGLAAVGVDDVGPGRAEFTGQGKQGAKVVQRMDGADEGRDDGKELRVTARRRIPGNLPARAWGRR